MDYETTHKVLTALEREGVRYVIFGGVALNLHGLARTTEDLDIFIAAERKNVERLRRALYSVFEDPEINEIDADDLLGEYPAVQYNPPTGGFHIDILTRLGEAYSFERLASQRFDFDGLEVNVVTPQMLYEMKKSTVRPQDWGDAERLRRRFGLGD